MRLVPVLFPSDLGITERGVYVPGGARGAPDLFLDMIEGEGVRFARPVAVPIEYPTDPEPADLPLKLDAWVARSLVALAEAVERVNADGDFPLILGGDHTAMLGQVLAHSKMHPQGIGLGVLADAYVDLATPATPVFQDTARLDRDPEVTKSGNVHRMVLAGALRMIPETFEVGRVMKRSSVRAAQTSVVGVRAPRWAQIKANEKAAKGVEVWRMDRVELDGESAYRSLLNRHLSQGPIALSIDVTGLDPHLMTAVRRPNPDGLDWSFLKRTLDQCIPHVDRILGLDISEIDPTKDDANKGAMSRLAETLAPFLKRLTR
ncbi:arginase family protein [Myxococcota bacterium]|nr:arginase family protein [Myxococcota bacterium]